MNKWLIILIAILIVPISSCAIMDRPELSAEEVTALVHQHCSQSNQSWEEGVASKVGSGLGELVADYQGNGKWLVSYSLWSLHKWEVYERTRAIVSHFR